MNEITEQVVAKAWYKSKTMWYGILSTLSTLFIMWSDTMGTLIEQVIGGLEPAQQLAVKSAMVMLNGLAIMVLRKTTHLPVAGADHKLLKGK